jgi:hypothetical protein
MTTFKSIHFLGGQESGRRWDIVSPACPVEFGHIFIYDKFFTPDDALKQYRYISAKTYPPYVLSTNFGQSHKELSDFNIAEIIYYNTKLNESQIENVEEYLINKYIPEKGGIFLNRLKKNNTIMKIASFNLSDISFAGLPSGGNDTTSLDYTTHPAYLDISNNITGTQPRTFEIKNMVFHNLNGALHHSMLTFGTQSNQYFRLDFRANSSISYIEKMGIHTASANPNWVFLNPVIYPGESVHFVFSYSSAPDYTCNYFVNGVKYSTQYISNETSAPLINTLSSYFNVGSSTYFDGTVDSINMYAGFIEELDQLDSTYTEINDLEIGNDISPDEFYLSRQEPKKYILRIEKSSNFGNRTNQNNSMALTSLKLVNGKNERIPLLNPMHDSTQQWGLIDAFYRDNSDFKYVTNNNGRFFQINGNFLQLEFYTSEKYHKIGLLPPYTAGDTYGNISGTGYNRGLDLIISIYSGGHGPFDSSGLSVDNKLIWTNGPNGTTLSDFTNLPDYTFIDNIFIDSNVNNHIKIEQLDNRMDDTLGYSVGQTTKNANYNSIHLDSFMVKCKVKIKDYKTNSSIFYIGENNIDGYTFETKRYDPLAPPHSQYALRSHLYIEDRKLKYNFYLPFKDNSHIKQVASLNKLYRIAELQPGAGPYFYFNLTNRFDLLGQYQDISNTITGTQPRTFEIKDLVFHTLTGSGEPYNSIMRFGTLGESDKYFSFDFRADSTATYIERIGIQTSSGNPNYINLDPPFVAGERIHFVFSYSSQPDYTCNYFVNGVKYSTIIGEIDTSSDDFVVGWDGSGNSQFKGTVDTINMYAGFIDELHELQFNLNVSCDINENKEYEILTINKYDNISKNYNVKLYVDNLLVDSSFITVNKNSRFYDKLYSDISSSTTEYRFNPNLMTWEQHEAEAVAWGGHLASITSIAENNHVLGLSKYYGGTSGPGFIGAKRREDVTLQVADEGGSEYWEWQDGMPWEFANWNTGEPNNTGEKTVRILNDGSWADRVYSANLPGIYKRGKLRFNPEDPSGGIFIGDLKSGIKNYDNIQVSSFQIYNNVSNYNTVIYDYSNSEVDLAYHDISNNYKMSILSSYSNKLYGDVVSEAGWEISHDLKRLEDDYSTTLTISGNFVQYVRISPGSFFDENNTLTLFDPSASTPGSPGVSYGQEYGPLNGKGWHSSGTSPVGYHYWNCKFNLPINCNKITVRINSRTSGADVDNNLFYIINIDDLKNNVYKKYKFRLDSNSETEELSNQLGIPITPSNTHPNNSVLDYMDINFDINPRSANYNRLTNKNNIRLVPSALHTNNESEYSWRNDASMNDGLTSFQIDADKITYNNYFTYSDDRLKYNEEDISNALSTVSALNPKFYIKTEHIYNDLDPSNLPTDAFYESGYIAQDVQNIPELNHVISGNENTVMSIDYLQIEPYLCKAIHELSEKISRLKEKLSILENNNN